MTNKEELPKYRQRARTIWCPKPEQDIEVKDEHDAFILDVPIGTIIKGKKKRVGWQNMDGCYDCPFLDRFDEHERGIFCWYPKTKEERENEK